jgi:hypothetical protein
MLKHGRKENFKEEAGQYLATRRMNQDRLLEKWSKVDVGAGLVDLFSKYPSRARNTAQLVENQERHMKKLTETIISQTFQTRPENVLKVVRIGSANSNRGDIFTEFPLTTVDDAIYFITMTYEQSLRGATADQKLYEKINKYYAGETYETVSSGSGTSHTISCLNYPLVKGKVLILIDRELVAHDMSEHGTADTTGTLTIVNSAKVTSGTVVYSSGVVSLTLPVSTAAASVVAIAQFDSEKSTLFDQYGTVSLTVTKERFNARPQPLGYTYSSMIELMLGTEGLGDVEDLLVGAVGDEHAKSRDYKAIALARSIALTNGAAYEFDTNFSTAGEVSDKMHAQKLLSKIGSIGGLIYDDVKRGMVNKAVAGSQALQYMKKHDLWKDDTAQVRTGVFKAGSLSDIDVYCCPAESAMVANDEILLTFKNPLEGLDIGLAFGVLTEMTASLAYPQFYTVGNVCAVEDYKPITKQFIRLLKLTNLTF